METPTAGRTILDRCFVFQVLDEAARQQLASRAHRRQHPAGEVIFNAGEPGQSMMAILRGMVRISLPAASGKEIILADLPEGEVFGEIALLDGRERSADARALTNCELIILDRRDVLPVLEVRPAACLALLKLICGKLRKSDERTAEIAFSDLRVRLARSLLTLIGEPGQPGYRPKLSATQKELGDRIGGTRENVNRHLREWQRRGILELKAGWIVVADRDTLAAIARGE